MARREIKVFVGSPGDVAAERKRAFEIIEKLNGDPGIRGHWRFEGIGWDQLHYPRLAWWSPQEAITEGIDRPGECDIAAFAFWKRIGTALPPGTFEENGAGPGPTGSTWEFHDAMGASPRPWVLVYHCQRPPVMSADELRDPVAFGQQIAGLQAFLSTFRDQEGRHTGDLAPYQATAEFADRFEKDLRAFVEHLRENRPGPGRRRAKVTERVPVAYLRKLKVELSEVELLGLDLKESITNGLPQVYVPAVTQRPGEPGDRERHFGREPRDLVLHRLGEESLYVAGDPGSGKSTFSRWVAYVVANGAVPGAAVVPEEVEEGALAERLPEALAGRLPLLVPLRDFWAGMSPVAGQQEWAGAQVEDALRGWVRDTRPFGLAPEVLDRNLEKGNLLLILDGVDEVPEEQLRDGALAYPRACLLSGLAAALPDWHEAGNRVLVTSRHYGLRAAQRARLRLADAPLLPLAPDLQRLFVERWFATADPVRARELTDGLHAELRHRGELGELRRNPLLLTALCVKFKEGKRLPQDIYDLYDAVVNQVLYNRFRGSDRERSRVRWRLEAVALGMHFGTGDDVRPAPLASVDTDELDRILARYAQANPSTEGGAARVLERREELLERSGLLLPRGEGRAEFHHQDFRDHLAAEGWAREGRGLGEALARFGTERSWRRMLGFLIAKTVAGAGVDRPLQALEGLTEGVGPQSLLLADCLEIAAGKAEAGALEAGWADCLRDVCQRGLEELPSGADRNELFLALGRLGWDTRSGVGLDAAGRPDIRWLPVPGRDAPDFHIACYPLTVAQFRAFVDAEDGYGNPRHWAGSEERRRSPDDPTWPEPNAPRTDVNWFEAMAFCRWLQETVPLPVAGGTVSLPLDAEWRAAYVGDGDDEFPWDGEPDADRHGNFGMTIERTSAVGIFPAGVARSGAIDMAGNVYEWCLDKSDHIGNGSVDASDDSRVLRGGAWHGGAGLLRSSGRGGGGPGYRGYDVGFRVVCRPPSSTDP